MDRLRTAVRNQNAPRDPWAESPVRRSSVSGRSRDLIRGPGSHFGGEKFKGKRSSSLMYSRGEDKRQSGIAENDTMYSSRANRAAAAAAPTTQRVTKYETVYRPSSWALSNDENRRDSGHGGDTTGSRADDDYDSGPARWRSNVPEAPRYSPKLQHETRKAPPPLQSTRQQNLGVQSEMGDAVAAAAAAYCTENRIPMRRVKAPTVVSGAKFEQRRPMSAVTDSSAAATQGGRTHHELLGYTPTGERKWRRYILEDKPLVEQIDENQEWVLGGYDLPPQRTERIPETAVMVDRELLEREEAERQAAEQEAAEREAAERELAEYRAAEREAAARRAAEERAAERQAAERQAAERESARRKAAEREVAQREAEQKEREERIAAEWEAERKAEMEQLMQRERMITEAREREMEREREREREREMEREERARAEHAMRQERERGRIGVVPSATHMKEEREEAMPEETFVKEERYYFTEETMEEPVEEAAEVPGTETHPSMMPAHGETMEPTEGVPAAGAWPEQGYREREEEEEEAAAEEEAREQEEARQYREREMREMRERDEMVRRERAQEEQQRMMNAREQAERQEEAEAAERMRQQREGEATQQKSLSRSERRRIAKEEKQREKQREKVEKAREREAKEQARRSSKQAKKDEKEKKEDDKKREKIEKLRKKQLEQQQQHEQRTRSLSQQQQHEEEELVQQHQAHEHAEHLSSTQKKSQEKHGSGSGNGLFKFLSRRSSKTENKVPEMAAPSPAAAAGGS